MPHTSRTHSSAANVSKHKHSSLLGYTSLNEEITVDQLPVTGVIPAWLTGSLLRNGPAKFEVGKEIGRAGVPHHIPFGFHGQFFSALS